MQQRDIRDTELYRETEALYEAWRQPGTGQISDVAELHTSPDGRHALFAGTILERLEGTPPTRICKVDMTSGKTEVLTFGPNIDRLPKYSPDGRHVGFLSDRQKAGDFQLYLLDPVNGAARPAAPVDGWIEYLHWSPGSRRILLGVAGHGADISGGQGAIASNAAGEDSPSWLPTVTTGDESYKWRSAWIYDLETGVTRKVSPVHLNIWESVWCGPKHVAAIVSDGPGEGLWYTARLYILNIETGESRELYAPRDQLGWPAASPSGEHLAFVEAVCSDRWVVAGDLRIISTNSGEIRRIDTRGVDVTYTEWRSDENVLIAGHRGLETVVGTISASLNGFRETWASQDLTIGGRYASVSGIGASGDCALVTESFFSPPTIATVRNFVYQPIRALSFANATAQIDAIADTEIWTAPDGLEIQGWLLRPKSRGPHPIVMDVHGGPVFHWRPRWLVRASFHCLMLIRRGYAVFLPNPRGSAGRGQDFARRVKGDLNGADTHDLLSGLDSLVQRGVADPRRVGVMGTSYGGNMTSWLITQDARFAAAVPVAPHTNQVTEHLLSNIPHFASMFLADRYNNSGGKYFQRSPVMHADKVTTPTLNVCGALDRCTPPEEAVQFNNALLENGVESVLVVYPEEGHAIRKLPALIDFTTRVVAWFEEHMGVGLEPRDNDGSQCLPAKQ
jgi:dipeptidyl aminopeptidase/acylaminoacyl peptidase